MHFHRNIPLMYAIACMQGMVFYGSIATLYRQAAGISVFQIALIESLSLVLGLLLELPWGMIADRIGYRRTMIACCWIYLASKLVFWRATDFAGFLAERVLLSVALAGISGVDTSILYLSCAPGQSQRAFGVYNNLMTGGLLLSAGIYARFLRDADRLSALLTCISYAVAAILSLFLKEVRPEDTKERIRPRVFLSLLKKVCRDAPLLCMLTGAALLNETHQIITVFFNQLQYARCGLSTGAIGAIYIGVTLIGLLGGFSARLTGRLGVRALAKRLYLTALVACLVLAGTTSAWLSIGAVALIRLAYSVLQPLQTELQNRRIVSGNRATMLSIYAVLINGVGIFTNLAFGRLAEVRLGWAMALGGGLCGLGLMLFLRGTRHGRGGVQPPPCVAPEKFCVR